MLVLVSTPIGHLADLTYRAVETLQNADVILCEDTRHSRKLLNHYKIDTPLKSFHKFNERKREEWILEELRAEKTIAVISDAGTPGISDPGQKLVAACREEGLPVTAVPGACAIIQALAGSGLPMDRFQFVGFLPKKSGRLTRILTESFAYEGVTVAYESPHRLLKSLKILEQIAPEYPVTVARELTKCFEEWRKGTPSELLKHWEERTVKGEIVLLIEGGKNFPLSSTE